jgi:hypothetical protein
MPALGGEAVILFERYEQKDKSGSAARRERPNRKIENNFCLANKQTFTIKYFLEKERDLGNR